MKKIYAVILSILVLCGSVFMSGCSDFAFNPIGKWENVESKTTEGVEIKDPYNQSFYLVFRHDGTAYMMLGDEYLIKSEYSYTYDDDKIVLTSKEENHVSVEYTIKDNGTVIESESVGIVNVYKRV